MKTAICVISLLILLSLTCIQLRPAAQSLGSSSSSITMTIYPNTSVGLAVNASMSEILPPGSEPNSTLTATASTSANNVTTLNISGTESLSQSELSQPPYNFSEASSITGSYSSSTGVAQGTISIHAVPGLYSPLSSFNLNYNGNSSVVTVSGSSTIEFGNYSGVVLNQSSIASYISQIKSEGFNSTALDSYFAMLPYSNWQVTSLSLAATNSSHSATTVKLDLTVTGNITALPAVMATYYYCSTSPYGFEMSNTSFPSQCQTEFTAFTDFFSSVQSYTYSSSYSNGLGGFTSQIVGANQFNLTEVQKLLGSQYAPSAAQSQLINETSVSWSGFKETLSATENQFGNYSLSESLSGVTVYPVVTQTGSTWNMSYIFDNATGLQSTVTLVGGSSSQGTVNFIIPSSVPAPAVQTATYAKWSSVMLSQLAPIEFSVGPLSSSSTTSTSSSGSSTSSSTNAKTAGSSYVLYAAIGAVVAVAVIAAVLFLTRRPGTIAPAPSAPATPPLS
jgi:hypothetical protein